MTSTPGGSVGEPAPDAPAAGRRIGARATSSARTAQPSMAVVSKPGMGTSARTSSARTRETASSTATSQAGSGATASSTSASASSNPITPAC